MRMRVPFSRPLAPLCPLPLALLVLLASTNAALGLSSVPSAPRTTAATSIFADVSPKTPDTHSVSKLDAETLAVAWATTTLSDSAEPAFVTSDGGLVVVEPFGDVAAPNAQSKVWVLDAANGTVRWGGAFSNILDAFPVPGALLLLVPGNLTAYSTLDGRALWTTAVQPGSVQLMGAVVGNAASAASPTVFLASDDDTPMWQEVVAGPTHQAQPFGPLALQLIAPDGSWLLAAPGGDNIATVSGALNVTKYALNGSVLTQVTLTGAAGSGFAEWAVTPDSAALVVPVESSATTGLLVLDAANLTTRFTAPNVTAAVVGADGTVVYTVYTDPTLSTPASTLGALDVHSGQWHWQMPMPALAGCDIVDLLLLGAGDVIGAVCEGDNVNRALEQPTAQQPHVRAVYDTATGKQLASTPWDINNWSYISTCPIPATGGLDHTILANLCAFSNTAASRSPQHYGQQL